MNVSLKFPCGKRKGGIERWGENRGGKESRGGRKRERKRMGEERKR